jgi:hypothetical protein
MLNLPPPHSKRIETLEERSATLSKVAACSNEALCQLTRRHKARFAWHTAALIIESVGTAFILLDTLRLNARTPPDALFTVGDPILFRHWYYHHAELGFFLLFLGILSQGYVLWCEHGALGRACEALTSTAPSGGTT